MDKQYQYLLFAAEPYEIIAFKVPSPEIDKVASKFFTHWDPDSKNFMVRDCRTPACCEFGAVLH
jgi:splicing factor 3A subunit 2